MNNFSKLVLSDEEQQLVNNPGWILTKRKIIDKVNLLLGALSEDLKLIIEKEKAWLPESVIGSTPKISKGENYLQLPYLVLDYPRCFAAENIFAVRTMFWWGHFFSMSVLLSGSHKETFQEKILNKLSLQSQDYFICINESPWHNHFETDNLIQAKRIAAGELEEIVRSKHFVKLAVKFPLHQWNDVPALLDKTFKEIIEMLKD